MRLFLAVDLPDSFRMALVALRRRLERGNPGWRWVDPRAVHLTLRFLGEIDPEQDRAARGAWRRAAATAEPFRLTAGPLGRFPHSGRPRVLWVGIRDQPESAAAALAAVFEAAARASGLSPEDRPFRGHLTLARAPRGARPRPPSEAGVPAELRDLATEVREAVLFRSELRPDGARYTALDRFPLASSGTAERETD